MKSLKIGNDNEGAVELFVLNNKQITEMLDQAIERAVDACHKNLFSETAICTATKAALMAHVAKKRAIEALRSNELPGKLIRTGGKSRWEIKIEDVMKWKSMGCPRNPSERDRHN